MSAKASTPTSLNVSPNLTIANITAFNTFSRHLLRDATITWNLDGRLNLVASFLGLSFHISDLDFHKEVLLKGFDGFRDFDIISADISHSNSTAIVVHLEAEIVNPSVIALKPAGEMYFDCFYQGLLMGSAVAPSLDFLPGANRVLMMDIMQPKPSDDPRAEEMFSKALAGESVAFTVVATGGSIPLYGPSLAGLQLNTSLTLQLAPLIAAVAVQHGEITMDPVDMSRVGVELLVVVNITNPLGADCPLVVRNISMDFTLLTLDGSEVGSGSTPSSNATASSDPSSFTVPLQAAMRLGPAFTQFAQQWTADSSVTLRMVGVAKATTDTVIGPMTISDIAVNTSTSLVGLDGFRQLNLSEVALSLQGGDSRGILASVQFTSFCASNVGIDLGDNSNLSLVMYSQGVQVGTSVVPHFALKPGFNVGVYPAILNAPSDPAVMEKLVSDFMNGVSTVLNVSTMQPHPSIYPALDPALSELATSTTLYGQHEKLMLSATMHAAHMSILHSIIPTTIDVRNSFDADIEVVACNTAVYYTKDMTQIATLNQDLHATPIKVPRNSTVTTPELNFHYEIHWDTFVAIFQGFDGVDLSVGGGTITVRFGGVFEQKVAYRQSGVITYMRF